MILRISLLLSGSVFGFFSHVIVCWVCTELLIDLYFRINHTQAIVVEKVHSGTSSLLAPDFNNDFLEFELMSHCGHPSPRLFIKDAGNNPFRRTQEEDLLLSTQTLGPAEST